MKSFRRIFVLLLCFSMCLGLVQLAFAEEPSETDVSFAGGVITGFADLGAAAAVSTDYKISLDELRKLLPAEITAELDGAEQAIAVEWACVENYDDDLDAFHFVPALEGYELADGVELPVVTVTILGEFEEPPMPFMPDDPELPEVPITGVLDWDEVELVKGSLPAKYDLFAQGKLPAVRNQGNYGTCWAHAVIGSMETDLIHDGVVNTSIDLSELHLAYYAFHRYYDEKGLNAGDGVYATGTFHLDNGGNQWLAYRVLANMVGTVKETAVPYSSASSYFPGTSEGRSKNAGYQLAGAYHINTGDRDAIKANIMAHGGILANIYYKTSDYYSYSYNSYYTDTYPGGTNHAIMLVGWDDNFSRYNFKTTAPGNGAWLVRNSWGYNGYNYNGYFWMSYYDQGIASTAMSFDTKNGQYDHCYSYDNDNCPVIQTFSRSGPVTTSQVYANVAKGEQIAAVGVVTCNPNLTLTIQVTCGGKTTTTTKKTTYEGYYLIPLSSPISVSATSNATVTVTYAGQSYISIPAEPASRSLWGISFESSCGMDGGRGMYIEGYGYTYKDSQVRLFTKNGGSSGSNLSVYSVKADKSTAKVGEPITWTTTPKAGTAPYQYRFDVYKGDTVVKKGSYGSSNTFTYTPTATGSFTVKGFVKDSTGTIKDKMSGAVTVTEAGPTLSVYSVKANKTTSSVGEAITWTITPKGGTEPYQYCFHVYKDDAVIKQTNYGSSSSFTYTPTATGSYTVKGFVKDSNGTIKNKMSGAVTVNAAGPALSVYSVKANKTTSKVGEPITWTITPKGGTEPYKYCFHVYKDDAVVSKGSYGTSNTFTYTPTATGSYTVKGFVKDSNGTIKDKMSGVVTVTPAVAALSVYSVKANKTTASVGEAITWTTTAKGGSEPYQYSFYVYRDDTLVRQTGYSTANTITYTPTVTGSYTVKGFVKDSNGTIKDKTSGAVTVTSSAPTLSVYSVKANKTTSSVGDPITWTTTPKGGTEPYQYCFYVYRDDTLVKQSTYSSTNTFIYTPTEPGSYTVKGYVKDSNGTVKNKTSGAVTVTEAVPALSVYSVKANKTTASVGGSITWTTTPKGGTGTYQYCFYVYKDGTVVKQTSYGASNTFTYKPTEPGSYTVKGYVKDSNGTIKNKMSAAVTVTA